MKLNIFRSMDGSFHIEKEDAQVIYESEATEKHLFKSNSYRFVRKGTQDRQFATAKGNDWVIGGQEMTATEFLEKKDKEGSKVSKLFSSGLAMFDVEGRTYGVKARMSNGFEVLNEDEDPLADISVSALSLKRSGSIDILAEHPSNPSDAFFDATSGDPTALFDAIVIVIHIQYRKKDMAAGTGGGIGSGATMGGGF